MPVAASTRRMRWLNVSEKYRLPARSNAMSNGPFSSASLAFPPSPANPFSPVPIAVVMIQSAICRSPNEIASLRYAMTPTSTRHREERVGRQTPDLRVRVARDLARRRGNAATQDGAEHGWKDEEAAAGRYQPCRDRGRRHRRGARMVRADLRFRLARQGRAQRLYRHGRPVHQSDPGGRPEARGRRAPPYRFRRR